MTCDEFNKKYLKYCEDGFEKFGPLCFDIPAVTESLDILFESCFIHVPDFKISQIKLKFGYARFYSSLFSEMNRMIERHIDHIVYSESQKKALR